MNQIPAYEELMDYRRSVAGMYAQTRARKPETSARWERFRKERDRLFAKHPQSPLSDEQKTSFTDLDYYEYDPALRYALTVEYDAEPGEIEIELQEDGLLRLHRFGRVRFPINGEEHSLSLFWVSGYGGGVFLPFKDATSGPETYGGGRYLLDTIKHADLGSEGGRLVLDFNYAYNPSCAYNPRWHCPLSPPENTLPVAIQAGEKSYAETGTAGTANF
ncbi:MAG: DUF1684 domain-containing protein [Rubrobacteraceae bacterium]